MKRRFFFLMMLILSGNATANIVINGTRLIYHEENDSITVQLNNNSQTSSLAQSWTDDGDINATPENSSSPFYVYPPIVKIDGMQGQQLKIKKNYRMTGKVSFISVCWIFRPPPPMPKEKVCYRWPCGHG